MPTKTTSTIVPVGNRLCITQRPEGAKPSKDLQVVGGIVIPESGATGKVMAPYYLATVLAAGPECKQVKKGDQIIAARGLDWEVKIDGKLIATMIRENEVCGILR